MDGQVFRYEPPGFRDNDRPPGAYDPVARLADLDDQGIWAELMFPSVGLWCSVIRNPDVARECAVIYNDWLHDTFLRVSDRYVGVAMLPVLDVADGVAEVQRTVGMGYRAVSIPATPPTPYNDPMYEPLWAAIAEAGVPITCHVGTGSNPITTRGDGGAVINFVETFFPMQRTALYLVAAGVFDRYPSMHGVFVEGGAVWLAALMERMDEAYHYHHEWVRPKMSRKPSDIVRDQVHATFQHDKAVLATLDFTGPQAVLWGSDYPHHEGTWPDTKDVLADLFDGVAPEVRAALTGDTFTDLFGVVAPA